MKKAFKIIYILIFMLICVTPLAFMPFVKNDASLEKRELAKLPAYMENGRLNIDFSTQFEAWFNDRIPFRPQLLSAANAIKGEVLHAPTSNAIIGRKGWLFYESEGADYMNSNALSEAQINATAISLSLMEEAITAKGGHFLFAPMPNKASVYGEYMPGCYTKADENNLTRVMDRCKEVGVNYVDMKAVMEKSKDARQLYHRRDSHWNYAGALLGYNAMMAGIGREHKTYADAAVTEVKNWRGDLDKLIYPAGGVMDYQYEYDINYSKFMFMKPAGVRDTQAQLENFMSDKEEGDDLFQTRNLEIGDGSTLYMARDSFGRALLPFIIDNYENVTFKRTDCPDIASLAENTDFIYEIVERNLNRLSEKAPFMYAIRRDASIAENVNDRAETTVYCDVQGYGISLYGAIPQEEIAGDGRVYLVLENESGKVVYEAFPIFEKELMSVKEPDTDPNGFGFSALISKEEGLSGDYRVTVLTGENAYIGNVITIK